MLLQRASCSSRARIHLHACRLLRRHHPGEERQKTPMLRRCVPILVPPYPPSANPTQMAVWMSSLSASAPTAARTPPRTARTPATTTRRRRVASTARPSRPSAASAALCWPGTWSLAATRPPLSGAGVVPGPPRRLLLSARKRPRPRPMLLDARMLAAL